MLLLKLHFSSIPISRLRKEKISIGSAAQFEILLRVVIEITKENKTFLSFFVPLENNCKI